jgi:hypothetical protein
MELFSEIDQTDPFSGPPRSVVSRQVVEFTTATNI